MIGEIHTRLKIKFIKKSKTRFTKMSLISVIINHYLHFYVKSLRKENGKNFLMFHVSEPDLLPVIHMKLNREILSLTQGEGGDYKIICFYHLS